MRILNLSLDNFILDSSSAVAARVAEYGDLADKYVIIVPAREKRQESLSEKTRVYGSGGANKFFQLFSICRLARRLFREYEFDLITVQDQYYLALVAWRLARKFKVGLEIQIHGFEEFFGIRRIIAKFVIPRANSIRVVSQRLKKRLIAEFGLEEKKITVAPIFSELRIKNEELRIKNKDKFIFLTVGRLVPVKNIILQIGAFKNLQNKFKNIELWIVGAGSEKENLKRLAMGVERINFFAWQDNLEEVYKKADVYLLTSNYEGWGMAIIEAAAYGLPIIMTDVGCAGEVIENEKSGLVIPVGDQAKLEEAMSRLIEDENLRTKLSQGAQAAVLKLPTKEETLALYKKSWDLAHNAQRITRNA